MGNNQTVILRKDRFVWHTTIDNEELVLISAFNFKKMSKKEEIIKRNCWLWGSTYLLSVLLFKKMMKDVLCRQHLATVGTT